MGDLVDVVANLWEAPDFHVVTEEFVGCLGSIPAPHDLTAWRPPTQPRRGRTVGR